MTKQKALVFLSEIEKEINLIRQTVDVIENRLNSLKTKTESNDYHAYVESLALNLQGFYEGIETVFEKVTDFTGEEKPEGPEWHVRLLERMSIPIKRLRPCVVSVETAKEVDIFRAFRHKVRHIYGFMIVPENVIAIAEKTKKVCEMFCKDIARFMVFIEQISEI
jgi:hypothetical protein